LVGAASVLTAAIIADQLQQSDVFSLENEVVKEIEVREHSG